MYIEQNTNISLYNQNTITPLKQKNITNKEYKEFKIQI